MIVDPGVNRFPATVPRLFPLRSMERQNELPVGHDVEVLRGVTLDPDNLLCQINGTDAPDLEGVDPRIRLR